MNPKANHMPSAESKSEVIAVEIVCDYDDDRILELFIIHIANCPFAKWCAYTYILVHKLDSHMRPDRARYGYTCMPYSEYTNVCVVCDYMHVHYV